MTAADGSSSASMIWRARTATSRTETTIVPVIVPSLILGFVPIAVTPSELQVHAPHQSAYSLGESDHDDQHGNAEEQRAETAGSLQLIGQDLQGHGGDQRTDDAAEAADRAHSQHERHLGDASEAGTKKACIVRGKGAGGTGPGGAVAEDRDFPEARVDADRTRRLLVQADRREIAAGAAAQQQPLRKQQQRGQPEAQEVEFLDLGDLEQGRNDQSAGAARDLLLSVENDLDDAHQGEGRHHEIDAADSDADHAQDAAGKARRQGADDHARGDGQAEMQDDERRDIAADGGKPDVTERELAGEARQEIPADHQQQVVVGADAKVEPQDIVRHDRQRDGRDRQKPEQRRTERNSWAFGLHCAVFAARPSSQLRTSSGRQSRISFDSPWASFWPWTME